MSASMFVDLNNQNMQPAASDMSRKKYIRSNICVICGLSFIHSENRKHPDTAVSLTGCSAKSILHCISDWVI